MKPVDLELGHTYGIQLNSDHKALRHFSKLSCKKIRYHLIMVAGLCHFVISSLRLALWRGKKTKKRHAKRRNKEKTPREKAK